MTEISFSSTPYLARRTALVVCVCAFAALSAAFFLLSPDRAVNTISAAVLTVAVALIGISPIVLLALWRSRTRTLAPVGVAAAIFTVEVLCLRIQSLNLFPQLTFNWEGKLLELAWLLFFLWVVKAPTPNEIGLTRKLAPGSIRPMLIVIGLFAVLAVAGQGVFYNGMESLLFQLTMPGIVEELAFRGILLALLNQAFGRPWSLFGARVGWGWIITSVLFGLVHMYGFDHALNLTFIPGGILTILFGLAAGWLKERTGNLWVVIVFHNIVNALPQFLGLLGSA